METLLKVKRTNIYKKPKQIWLNILLSHMRNQLKKHITSDTHIHNYHTVTTTSVVLQKQAFS